MSRADAANAERFLATAKGAVKRAAALTHRLLSFSRRQALDPKATNLNQLVGGMEDLIRRAVGPGVHMEVVGAGGLWPTLVDQNQLENTLLNICVNARDAMPDGGRITIETANKWLDDRAAAERELPPGQYVSLCVTDTGVGMPAHIVNRAFDPFFTTKPIGSGTGLGLSMAYGFARQSGGQIRIYSEIDKGSTVCVYLPRHGEEPAEDDADPARAELRARGDGRAVLVIDDEPSVRALVVEALREAGYAAVEASDGPSGLRALKASPNIEFMITDVGLPGGMNGRQVADAARFERPGLKVLFITGYAENAVVGNGHLEKGMSLLTKPFAMADLDARSRRCSPERDGSTDCSASARPARLINQNESSHEHVAPPLLRLRRHRRLRGLRARPSRVGPARRRRERLHRGARAGQGRVELRHWHASAHGSQRDPRRQEGGPPCRGLRLVSDASPCPPREVRGERGQRRAVIPQ